MEIKSSPAEAEREKEPPEREFFLRLKRVFDIVHKTELEKLEKANRTLELLIRELKRRSKLKYLREYQMKKK